MADPDVYDDELILFQTPDVFVKSVPFEAVLTDKRVIFIDRKKEVIPAKEIPLSAIRDVEPGENAIRDPTLTLLVHTGSGGNRQMVMTFSRYGGGGRERVRDEWVQALKKLKGSPVRDVMSALGMEQKKIIRDSPAPPGSGFTGRRSGAKEGRPIVPIERMSARDVPEEPAEEGLPPYGSFCTKCGNRLQPGSAFCNRCGTKVAVPARAMAAQVREEPDLPEEQRAPRRAVTESARPQGRKSDHKKVFGRAGPQNQKKGFLSWLFPKKKQRSSEPPHPAEHKPRPPARRPPSGSRKKVFLAIGIVAVVVIVAAVCAFVLIPLLQNVTSSPATADEESSGSTGAGSSPVVKTTAAAVSTTAVVVRTTAAPSIPSDGVYINVSYIGAWKGTYGVAGSLTSLSRSGTFIFEVEDASGTVEANFQKTDASTKPWPLSVEIYKNGVLLNSKTTTEPLGAVSVSASV